MDVMRQIKRVRVPEPVVTELAVCFLSQEQRFVVRYTVRWPTPTGEIGTESVCYPLTRQQLTIHSGGPELADQLMDHPDYWWRMPLPTRPEEGYAA